MPNNNHLMATVIAVSACYKCKILPTLVKIIRCIRNTPVNRFLWITTSHVPKKGWIKGRDKKKAIYATYCNCELGVCTAMNDKPPK